MTIQGAYRDPMPIPPATPNRPIIDPKYSNLRVYQVWRGNNRFCFGGRLVFGPDLRSIFLTISLILVPVILFCVFVSRRLIEEFQQLGILIVAICSLFTIYVIFLLLLTSGRDPGIIPRNLNPPENIDDDCDISAISSEWPGSQVSYPSVRPTKDVVVNGIIVRVKYCHTCMLYRPPRCSHCSVCNNCVERFDHHCPWVGQCIGKRNYRFFFMFVSSTTLLCLYVFAFSWINIKNIMDVSQCGLLKACAKSPVSVVLMLYTFIAAWFVGGLTSFHLYLITSNQTTYENFRYQYDRKRNPYNRGCLRNTGGVFFSKIPRSKNNFREKVYLADSTSGFSVSPKYASKAPDLEMGKRRGVAGDDLESNYPGLFGGLERCETEPIHSNYDPKTNYTNRFDVEFEAEHGLQEKEKRSTQ